MDVSKLSKVELNRAMIWPYPHLNSFIWTDTGTEVWVGPKTLTNPHWSYLLNWNLTMPLAVANGLDIELTDEGFGDCGTITKYRPKDADLTVDFDLAENTLRAICEVLFMIKMEGKSWMN